MFYIAIYIIYPGRFCSKNEGDRDRLTKAVQGDGRGADNDNIETVREFGRGIACFVRAAGKRRVVRCEFAERLPGQRQIRRALHRVLRLRGAVRHPRAELLHVNRGQHSVAVLPVQLPGRGAGRAAGAVPALCQQLFRATVRDAGRAQALPGVRAVPRARVHQVTDLYAARALHDVALYPHRGPDEVPHLRAGSELPEQHQPAEQAGEGVQTVSEPRVWCHRPPTPHLQEVRHHHLQKIRSRRKAGRAGLPGLEPAMPEGDLRADTVQDLQGGQRSVLSDQIDGEPRL